MNTQDNSNQDGGQVPTYRQKLQDSFQSMNTPTPSLAQRITPETPPVFPCWAYRPEGGWFWFQVHGCVPSLITFTHWHPDQETAPTEVPTTRHDGRPEDEPLADIATPAPASDTPDNVMGNAELTAFIDNMPEGVYGSAHDLDRYMRQNGFADYELGPIASRTLVYALRTELAAMREAQEESKAQLKVLKHEDARFRANSLDKIAEMAYEANQLRARLTAAEAENERLENLVASGIHTCSDDCQRPLCVMRRKLDAAEQRLALAEKERNDACQVITDLRLGPPGGKPVSPEFIAAIDAMNDAAAERLTHPRTATNEKGGE